MATCLLVVRTLSGFSKRETESVWIPIGRKPSTSRGCWGGWDCQKSTAKNLREENYIMDHDPETCTCPCHERARRARTARRRRNLLPSIDWEKMRLARETEGLDVVQEVLDILRSGRENDSE